jgi:hypothetical protein
VARLEVHGGAIFAKASVVLGIASCVFSGCAAHGEDSSRGGVLHVSGGSEISFNRSIANDSSANTTCGFGDIRLSSNGRVRITLTGMSKTAEAALAVGWCGVTITDANFTSNDAPDSGSGLQAERQGAGIVRYTVLSENKRGNLICGGVEAGQISYVFIVRNRVACTCGIRACCTWIWRRSPSRSLERTGSMYSLAAPPRSSSLTA